MMFFFIISAFLGILLGLRFKVLALVPAILFLTIVVILTSHGDRVIAPTVFGTIVLLQFGYLVGCVFRVVARDQLRVRKMYGIGRRKRLAG